MVCSLILYYKISPIQDAVEKTTGSLEALATKERVESVEKMKTKKKMNRQSQAKKRNSG